MFQWGQKPKERMDHLTLRDILKSYEEDRVITHEEYIAIQYIFMANLDSLHEKEQIRLASEFLEVAIAAIERAGDFDNSVKDEIFSKATKIRELAKSARIYDEDLLDHDTHHERSNRVIVIKGISYRVMGGAPNEA